MNLEKVQVTRSNLEKVQVTRSVPNYKVHFDVGDSCAFIAVNVVSAHERVDCLHNLTSLDEFDEFAEMDFISLEEIEDCN